MSTRIIKLKLLTQSSIVTIETSARTFGELKAESAVKALKIPWNSTKLIDKDTKVTFDLDESVLPAISCLMFVTPTKTKSGADLPYKEVKAKLKEYVANGGVLDFNYTQATTARLNEAWNEVKNKFTKKPVAKKEVAKVVETIKASKTMVKPEVKVEPKEDSILVKDIVEVITKDDIQKEAEYLKSKFYK